MFRIIFIIISFVFLCLNANAAGRDLLDRDIIRVSKDMFVGKKKIPYKNSNGTLNEEGDDVYFVFEKLTEDNIYFWQEYNRQQSRDKHPAGTVSFKISLDLLANNNMKSDIWIVYATHADPRKENRWNSKIEMTCSVLLNKETPITTHMGISRNFSSQAPNRSHLGLSVELHAFAANAYNLLSLHDTRYQKKKYMITNPEKEMSDILFKAFSTEGFESRIWIGDSNERKKAQDAQDAKDLIFIKMESYPFYPKDISYMPPFDNRHPINWRILINERMWQDFQRPDWFPSVDHEGKHIPDSRGGGYLYGHHHLLNQLSTAIIDIQALSSLWKMSSAEKAVKAAEKQRIKEEQAKKDAEEERVRLEEEKVRLEARLKKEALDTYKIAHPMDTVDSIELGLSLVFQATREKALIDESNLWIREKNERLVTRRGVRGFYTPRAEQISPPIPFFIFDGIKYTGNSNNQRHPEQLLADDLHATRHFFERRDQQPYPTVLPR